MADPSALTVQLRDKALVALEHAIQECRYRTPKQSYAVRFALAYLWVYGGCGDRSPFDDLWREMRRGKSLWSFTSVDGALLRIYRVPGVERDQAAGFAMWRLWQKHQGEKGD
jgi:hypothetical protein